MLSDCSEWRSKKRGHCIRTDIFCNQTYRQEVADHFNELDEDNRRLVVRGDIKQWNQMLAETAHNAGVITNEEFAIFKMPDIWDYTVD